MLVFLMTSSVVMKIAERRGAAEDLADGGQIAGGHGAGNARDRAGGTLVVGGGVREDGQLERRRGRGPGGGPGGAAALARVAAAR